MLSADLNLSILLAPERRLTLDVYSYSPVNRVHPTLTKAVAVMLLVSVTGSDGYNADLVSIKLSLYRDSLIKKARKGFRGYPMASIAFYGPDDQLATKIAVGIMKAEADDPTMSAWHREDGDIRRDGNVWQEVARFVQGHHVKSVAMASEILGCPHQEGIDYPDGESCPQCPFWENRPRPFGLSGLDQGEEAPHSLPHRGAMEQKFSGLGTAMESTSLQKAQEMIWNAWEEPARKRRIEMARVALRTSPDCADAYNLLAEESAQTIEETCRLYAQGVQAGERALGPTMFKENGGHFWGILETRPYMRARAGLAEALADQNHLDEAIMHLKELLRLNPNDNQGNRSLLRAYLIEANRNAEASELLDTYHEPMLADWSYTAALLAFRMSGPGAHAASLLTSALEVNRHVPQYLLRKKRLPRQLPPHFSVGSDDEAIVYAKTYSKGWNTTPGALEWLALQI